MPKFDDRFARQNRYEPPPEFPLASPYSSIVHHLSGPSICAPAQTFGTVASRSADAAAHPEGQAWHHHTKCVTFITRTGLITQTLAHMLDSLVRVSRRVAYYP